MPAHKFFMTKRVLALTILIGIIAGLGALVFYTLLHICTQIFLGIAGYHPPSPAGEKILIGLDVDFPYNRYLLIIIPAIGGLLSGVIVYTFAPEAEGHGTDAVIEAFHKRRGFIRGRVPIVKVVASALTIGSGGSAGREGPIAQIGAGFASYIASKLRLSDREKEVLVLCGMSAGIGSIFKSPFGASLFGIEVLYHRDYEADAFIPVIISSFVAYGVFASITGWNAIFETPTYAFSPYELPLFAILGVITGLLAKLYVYVFYGLRDNFFKKLKIPDHFKPAIGGFMVGLLAYFVPECLATGYGWVQMAMYGKLAIEIMLILIFAKILATSFTISSGGSGGVFAPSLVIGAMIGGVVGLLFKILFPDIVVEPGIFVLIGMASFFAGAANVPLASIVMVSEMTGGYNILVPAILASAISYFVSGETTIYEKQLASKVESPVHMPEYISSLLEAIKVKEVVSPDVVIVQEDMKLLELESVISKTKHLNLPVVNKKGEYVGIVSLFDVLALPTSEWDKKTVGDIVKCVFAYVTPEDSLSKAVSKMLQHGILRLPVVDSAEGGKVIGEVSYDDIVKVLYFKSREIG